jgi:hypothetical protein
MDWRRSALLAGGNPAYYLRSLGTFPYEWQESILDQFSNRIVLLAPRQSGKSLIVAGLACHTARTKPGGLTVVIAPKLNQAMETARKIKDFISMDIEMITKRSNDSLVELDTGSRILCLAATENAPRGYSAPDLIILDEASRIPDDVYAATRPQLTTNPEAKLVIISTPFGKSGFFWRAWSEETYWKKVRVETGFDIERTAHGLKVVKKEVDLEAEVAKWKQKGVEFYLSPHHRRDWLQEELDTVGEWWFSQEYGLEFKDSVENLFDFDDIRAAFADTTVLPEAIVSMENELSDFTSDMEALVI